MPRLGTPPAVGVPVPEAGAYGDDAVPDAIPTEDTGRLATRLMAIVSGVDAMPEHSDVTPERLIDMLAGKVAERVGGNGGGGPPPPKKFLGLDGGAWTKFLVGYLIAAVAGVFFWWLAVRDGLAARPTRDEINTSVDRKLNSAVDRHSDKPHPPTENRLKVLEGEQRTIRDSQIRQEQIDKTQTEVLKEIKDDVKRIRRRGD